MLMMITYKDDRDRQIETVRTDDPVASIGRLVADAEKTGRTLTSVRLVREDA